MGVDIRGFAEVKKHGKWVKVDEKIFSPVDGKGTTSVPFSWRSYRVFGFLADVKNYSKIPVNFETRGLPLDSEYLNEKVEGEEYLYGIGSSAQTRRQEITDDDNFSRSWLLLRELVDFNYDQTFEDRRVMKQDGPNSWNSAALAEEGEGVIVTYRDFLMSGFFNEIEILKTLGEPESVRIVFYFF